MMIQNSIHHVINKHTAGLDLYLGNNPYQDPCTINQEFKNHSLNESVACLTINYCLHATCYRFSIQGHKISKKIAFQLSRQSSTNTESATIVSVGKRPVWVNPFLSLWLYRSEAIAIPRTISINTSNYHVVMSTREARPRNLALCRRAKMVMRAPAQPCCWMQRIKPHTFQPL